MSEEIILITAKYLNYSDVVPVTVEGDDLGSSFNSTTMSTIKDVREQLLNWFSIPPSSPNVTLILKGKKLCNEQLLVKDCSDLKNGCTVYIVSKGGPAAAAAAGGASIATPKVKRLPTPAVPRNNGKALSAMITQMMSSNPDLMIEMMQHSNPGIKKLLDENPQMRHLLRDPQHITEMLEANNDPSKMLEMQRGQDRALSNIENMPGGMQALQSLYLSATEAEDAFKAPSFNGGVDRFGTGNDGKKVKTKTSKSNVPLPNPWSSKSVSASKKSKTNNTGVTSDDSSDSEEDDLNIFS